MLGGETSVKKYLLLIYEKVPTFLQDIFISFYGLLREYQRYGGNYRKYTKWLLETEKMSESDLISLQFEQLKSFIIHAYDNVPYYKKLFNEKNINPGKISSIQDLKKIPILSKETLRKKQNLFQSRNFAKHNLLEFHTSGTTGKALTITIEKDDFRKRMAFLERQRIWASTTNGKKVATFTGKIISTKPGTKKFWRYNYFGRQLYFSSYHTSEENLIYYVNALDKFNPEIIEGYPSAIFLVAQWVLNNSYKHSIRPKAILTTGETLLDHQKEVIEKAFNTTTYNYYASSEGAPFITQCEFGELHINPESGIFEILDEHDKPITTPGKTGQLVVTSFLTRATPLIRYRINDSVVTSDKKCKCGRNFPVIERIIGRVDDMLYTLERGYIGRLSPAIKAFPNSVIEVQFIQNSVDEIDLYIVPDKEKFQNSHLALVIEEIKKRTGDNIKITPHLVNEIARGSNNKFRLTVRNFTPQNSINPELQAN